MMTGMSSLATVLSAGAFLLAAVGAVACSSAVGAGEASARPALASRATELIRLRTRDGDVAVLVGSAGRRVALYDARGTLLRSADLESLRSSDPALFQLLTTATGHNTYLDATLHGAEGAAVPNGVSAAAAANGR
jgi:hypothetical protein